MLTEIILKNYRQSLSDSLSQTSEDLPTEPLIGDSALAKSALQKAIRRGDTSIALSAAARLLMENPRNFWRRLVVIAFEDVGIADLDSVAETLVGAASKHWRSGVGGEWKVASYIVARLSAAVKDRSADDLAVVIEYDGGLQALVRSIHESEIDHRFSVAVASENDLVRRAIAGWSATGAAHFPYKADGDARADATGYFDRLFEAGVSATAVALGREGFRITGLSLPALFPLIAAEGVGGRETVGREAMPPTVRIRGVPSYVFDLYTRPGRHAIRAFLKRNVLVGQALEAFGGSAYRREQILGGILFRIESACVDRRLDWSVGHQLRERADRCWLDAEPSVIDRAFETVRSEIDHLNEIRKEVFDDYLR